jgi:3-dehydroquinate dehydratase-1
MRFCLSIGNPDFAKVEKEIQTYEWAEIRLDLCRFSKTEISRLVQNHGRLIFTFRSRQEGDEAERLDFLSHAIDEGAAYIDIDVGNPILFRQRIRELIDRSTNTKLLLSYHNFDHMPTNHFLFDQILEMGKMDPEIIKLVCTSHGERDNRRILSFNESFDNIIAFNMGEKGRKSRWECLYYGAPFTYVAMEGEPTAAGQVTRKEMMKYLENEKLDKDD